MDAYAEYATFGIAVPLVMWFVYTHWRELKGLSLLERKRRPRSGAASII